MTEYQQGSGGLPLAGGDMEGQINWADGLTATLVELSGATDQPLNVRSESGQSVIVGVATSDVLDVGLNAVSIAPVAGTSGTPTALTLTGGAHTGLTAATEDIGVNFDLSATKTWAAGAGPLAAQREVRLQAPTYVGDAGGALTITDAATLYVDAAPTAGANMTISNAYAIWVDAGTTRLDGTVNMGGGVIHKRTASAAGAYTILVTDYIIGKTGITGGGDTLTLPAIAGVTTGQTFIIKDERGGAGTDNITIDGNGAETIDGAATAVLSTNYGAVNVYYNGTEWSIF